MGIFRSTLEQYKNKNQQKIVFIHGKGEGVLRRSIIRELNYKSRNTIFKTRRSVSTAMAQHK